MTDDAEEYDEELGELIGELTDLVDNLADIDDPTKGLSVHPSALLIFFRSCLPSLGYFQLMRSSHSHRPSKTSKNESREGRIC